MINELFAMPIGLRLVERIDSEELYSSNDISTAPLPVPLLRIRAFETGFKRNNKIN